MRGRSKGWVRHVSALAVAGVLTLVPAAAAAEGDITRNPFDGGSAEELTQANAVPGGFEESVAFSGLINPTAVRFAPDGRIFVAEKSGLIKYFDGMGDTTPTVFADLRTQTHDFWDRGMLGMALDPNFSVNGRVYVLYTRNEEMFSTTMPRWANDGCPTPPGPTADGCVVTGTLSRLSSTGVETRLIEKDWCQQYASHSIGSVVFGGDGMLYVSAGDGASFNFADYGQDGSPLNPCGDPPSGVGGTQTPPTAEGGALRSQDLRTSGDPATLDGSVLRLDPETGAAAAGNPNAGSSDPNTRRIVAQGMRNPFRMTARPGTNEIWFGDVGWTTWEEINRIPNPTAGVTNFGWPCYEGGERQSGYDGLNLNICENLYGQGAGAVQQPIYTYNHGARVLPNDPCPSGGSSIAGLAFYPGGAFPDSYDGALFWADYTRDCIWVMYRGSNGQPDPNTRQTFVSSALNPVDLQVGPGGDLFYADFDGGTIRRVRYLAANQGPTARATATPSSGAAPLAVQFDGRSSSDPDGDALTYAWDLDGDGQFDDSTSAQPTFTYAAGTHTIGLRVSDPGGLQDSTTLTVTAGTPPTATIDTPTGSTTWKVGDVISFSGSARDSGGNALAANRLTWTLDLRHCSRLDPNNCHTHEIQTFDGVASGTFTAPDHEYPSHLNLRLTATDDNGLTDTETVRLDPRTVDLTFASSPSGLTLSVGSDAEAAPFTRRVIVGSSNSVSASSPQSLGGTTYDFASWSDGGAASHNLVAPAANTTYTATFSASASGLMAAYAFNEGSGATLTDASGRVNNGTITAGTWSAAGRNGGALSFNGTSTRVSVPDSNSLDLTSGMTLMGWVRPTALGAAWRTLMIKERPGSLSYGIYANDDSSRASGWAVTASGESIAAPGQLALNTWTHLATTYDGSMLRIYVNGVEAAARAHTGALTPSTNPLQIGGNANWGEYFAGLIDDIRIYDRALTTSAIVGDMNRGVTSGPPPPPTLTVTPASLSFTGTVGGSNPAAKTLAVSHEGTGPVNWSATDDQPWLSVSPGSGSSPGTITVTASLAGLSAGTYSGNVTVTAPGADGSPKTIPVSFTVQPQAPPPALSVTPASLSFSATAGGANPAAQQLSVANTGGGTLTWTASSPETWIGESPASGSAPGSVTVSINTAGLAPGNYSGSVTVTASGATGSPKTIPVSLALAEPPPPPTGGLVAAYGFEEGTGTGVADRSGSGNTGAISGATWTTAGRSGRALTFDGVNDWVTIPDANSLDLTTGMTLEAWVYPTTLAGGWRTILLKESASALTYAMYGAGQTNRPSAWIVVGATEGSTIGTAALPLNAWSHVAATYDGAVLRFYANGTQVATRNLAGALNTSSNPLRIGGNAVWNEWFAGRIDEVRVYNRALTQSELQADMAAPVGPLAGATGAGATARRTRVARRARVRAPKVLSLKAERRRRALPMRSHRAARARQLRLDALRRAGRYAAYRKELRRRWTG